MFYNTLIFLILSFTSVLTSTTEKQEKTKPSLLTELPEWLKPCRRKDPNLNKCMNEALQIMFPALSRGIPEIDVEKFEPLFIKTIGVSKGAGAVSLTGGMEDLLVHGPSNATITFVNMDLVKKKWQFGIEVPYLRLEAKYNIKGNILLLPVVGTGDSTVHIRDAKCIVTTKFEFRETEGREIIHVTSMHVDFSLAGMRLHLGNLFNGNKVLGQTVNQFLNKNAIQVVDELKEDIGKSLSGVFIVILNNAFKHMPLDLWLLKD